MLQSTLNRRAFLPFLLSPFVVGGCQPSPVPREEAKANKIVELELALNWYPEAEHGGYFAASVHRYFNEENVNVSLTPGGPGVPVVQNVATGRSPFAIANADQVLTGRAAGADVVAVFAPLQISPRCILVHEKSGIKSFEDLKNAKKLAMNANSTFAMYLQKHVSLEGCTIVAYPGNVAQFLLEEDYAQQGYVFSEPYLAKKKGGDPVSLLVADLGFNPYTSLLITSGDTIRNKTELVRKMVAASQRGWVKYLAEPALSHERIHQQNPEMEIDVLDFGVGELKKLCYPESITDANFGTMTSERWSKLSEQLVECGSYEAGKVKVDEAFTTEFLPHG